MMDVVVMESKGAKATFRASDEKLLSAHIFFVPTWGVFIKMLWIALTHDYVSISWEAKE